MSTEWGEVFFVHREAPEITGVYDSGNGLNKYFLTSLQKKIMLIFSCLQEPNLAVWVFNFALFYADNIHNHCHMESSCRDLFRKHGQRASVKNGDRD